MVCDKCEKKLSRSAVPDVWKEGSRNAGAGQNEGKTLARNSYLESRSKGAGRRFAPGAGKLCRICKSKLSQDAEYCNQCAFSKAICAMCGVSVADLKFDKRGVETKKKKIVQEDEVEETSNDLSAGKETTDQPQKKKKKAKVDTPKDEMLQPVVNDAAGLALEAISMRTGRAQQATVGGEQLPQQASTVTWMSALDAGSGKTYYYNQTTGVTQWTDPTEPEWKSTLDAASGKTYEYNTKTGETKWTD